MKKVQGIYDDDDQLMMLATLTDNKPMMGAIFYLGVVSGLRIGDLLTLQVRDVGQRFVVTESKTKKRKLIRLCDMGWSYLENYIFFEDLKPDDLLFKTTRQTVHKYFSVLGQDLGLESIGTHSMRYSYG